MASARQDKSQGSCSVCVCTRVRVLHTSFCYPNRHPPEVGLAARCGHPASLQSEHSKPGWAASLSESNPVSHSLSSQGEVSGPLAPRVQEPKSSKSCSAFSFQKRKWEESPGQSEEEGKSKYRQLWLTVEGHRIWQGGLSTDTVSK